MLFRRLSVEFADVKVRHAGEERIATVGLTHGGKSKTAVTAYGETYMVPCPFCRDRDFSLAISYEYGQADGDGEPQIHLASCFRRQCLTIHPNRLRLAETLRADDGILAKARIRHPEAIDEAKQTISLPSHLTRVDLLPKNHPACAYLSACGFRPDALGRLYEISYCSGGSDRLARDRIIVPVRKSGVIAGWQAIAVPDRSPPDGDAAPQYMSCKGMMNGRLVYNLDRARKYETAVLVPGPMQVWAIGVMGISALGGRLSDNFCRQVATAFRGSNVVVLMPKRQLGDRHVQGLIGDLETKMPGRVAVVAVPKGVPAGAPGRKALRQHVIREADGQGVSVSFVKRS
jgi:hypothetical protein